MKLLGKRERETGNKREETQAERVSEPKKKDGGKEKDKMEREREERETNRSLPHGEATTSQRKEEDGGKRRSE